MHKRQLRSSSEGRFGRVLPTFDRVHGQVFRTKASEHRHPSCNASARDPGNSRTRPKEPNNYATHQRHLRRDEATLTLGVRLAERHPKPHSNGRHLSVQPAWGVEATLGPTSRMVAICRVAASTR
jgi:hypothetical protein